MQDETIIILANAEWDWSNRVNCHHIAARLAKHNTVLFVDTIGGRTPAPREFKKIARRLRRIAGGVRQIGDGLIVLSPFVLPFYRSEFVRRINTRLLAWQIRRALPRGATRPIAYLFLPALVGLIGALNEKLVVYHCVDVHAANPNVPAREVRAREEQLLRAADVVFTSAATLYAEKRALNAHTYYVPNVADAEHFARARDAALPIADAVRDLPHPLAGFIGNLTAYKVDFDLLSAVAARAPGWTFALIGPIGRGDPSTDLARLHAQPNIRVLGEMPYAELPRAVKAFDVCLIPFNQNASTRGTFPMKFFEYLAAGKPVIATDLPALAEFSPYFYTARNADEFLAALDAAQHEDATCINQRMTIAQKYSWDARIREIETILTNALAERAR
ncbi:MAG: glycosyltransferase [Chloroflexi bacterium]|nr:glycosyltransferase [Chloroflexota bacterium]